MTTRRRGRALLALEVSERHLLTHRIRARDRLLPIRNLGVEIIVDDFGASAATADADPWNSGTRRSIGSSRCGTSRSTW